MHETDGEDATPAAASADAWPAAWSRPHGPGLVGSLLVGALGAVVGLSGLAGLAWWAAAGSADDLAVLGGSAAGVGLGLTLLCLAFVARPPRPGEREQLREVSGAAAKTEAETEYALVITRRSGRALASALGHVGVVVAALGALVADAGGFYGFVVAGLVVVGDRSLARLLAAPVHRIELTSGGVLVSLAPGTVRVAWDDVRAVDPVEHRHAVGRTRAVSLAVRREAVTGPDQAVAALATDQAPPGIAIPTAGLAVPPERLLALVRRFHAEPDERESLLTRA